MPSIFTITGSDNSGFSGLQQDIRIISGMGCHAMTAATFLAIHNTFGMKSLSYYRADEVHMQVENIINDYHPDVVKVGMVGYRDSVKAVAEEIRGCRKIVVAPGFIFSAGRRFLDDDTLDAIMRYLVPIATIVVLRCSEAEAMLGIKIATDDDMRLAANAFLDMGAEYVLLRGGTTCKGRVTALLAGEDTEQFFSSYYIEGWQRHGVGGALSTAIACRLGMGDDVPTALRNAHEFIHSRVVYALNEEERNLRPTDIYNDFLNLIADNYAEIHDVYTYAQKLNVSTRYLSMITSQIILKSPKQVISDYLMEKARQMLVNSRLSVKEISAHLGFRTNPVFCKFFKQQEGITPSEYRSSCKTSR